MTEQMTALAENYPAAAELLRRHGGETLLTYLGQLHHQPLPDILPSEDLLTEVRDYFTPFFGAETAGECADVLRRRRCLSTANHHHPAFEYMTVQDTILCDQWLRQQGETGTVVPFLSCANPRLDNNVYPRGMLVYDCTAPEGCLRLPFYPFKLRHACVAAVEGISPDMVDNALNRLRQETRRGSCSLRTADALERFCREVLLSDRVQRCGTLREQTTVINAMLSQRYFTAARRSTSGCRWRRSPPACWKGIFGRKTRSPAKCCSGGSCAHRFCGSWTAFPAAGRETPAARTFSGDSTAARRCFPCGCARARARRRWRVKTRWERL